MKSIEMISIDRLRNHPNNVRMNLGDLTELADSIKAKGIMQNLTVVQSPSFAGTGLYWVVIGNRRLEASRMAGLTEMPCVVSDMSMQEQIATMMSENMQREDLTVYEQAQGMQIMMDFGFTKEQIREKTGLSDTTIRRRLKMAELDKDTLKWACNDVQLRMEDFDKLAQVEDKKKRNEILAVAGTNNFVWKLNQELRFQHVEKVLPEAISRLQKKGIKELESSESFSKRYERLYAYDVDLAKWQPGNTLIPSLDKELFYRIQGSYVCFYVKADKKQKEQPEKKTAEEIAEERKIKDAWETIRQDTKLAKELRGGFVKGLKWSDKMLPYLMKAIACSIFHYSFDSDRVKKLLGFDGGVPSYAEIMKRMGELPTSRYPELLWIMYESHSENGYVCGPQRCMPMHTGCLSIDACYEWLTDFGYKMSDMEISLQEGTHKCFGGAD